MAQAARTGFALIGAGLFGEQHARAYQRHPAVSFEAVCDLDAARAEAIATRYGARRWTTDIDSVLGDPAIAAVSVATPDHAHRDVTITCLRAGRHVLLEKPLATTLSDAVAIADVAAQASGKLMLDFHNRLNPPMVAAREAVAAGQLGKPSYVYARLSNRLDVPEQMLRWSRHSSALWFLGSHMIDVVCWILGERPVRVFALKREGILSGKGIPTADFHVAMLEFPSGVVANFEHGWILPRGQLAVKDLKLEILGSDGAVYVDGSHNRALEIYSGQGGRFQDVLVPAYGPRLTGFVLDAIAAFVAMVTEDGPMLADVDDGVANTRIIESIMASADAGGRPLGLRVADALSQGGADPVVAVGGRAGNQLGLVTVPDRIADQGPLAGLASILLWARTGLVVVAPCDLPLLTGAHVAALVAAAATDPRRAGVAVTGPARRPQPSLACWPAAAGPVVQKLVDAGHRAWRDALTVVDWIPVTLPDEAVADADTPASLDAILHNDRPYHEGPGPASP